MKKAINSKYNQGIPLEELFAGLLSGVLLAFSFPPYPFRFLVFFAFVPIFNYFTNIFPRRFEEQKSRPGSEKETWKFVVSRGFLVGFSLGVAFFSILIFWIANLIPESSVHHPEVIIPGLVLLIIYLSLYPAISGIALSCLVGRFGSWALILAPSIWSLTELARSRGELGFSWGVVAYSLVKYPIAIQGASVYGMFGLSLMVVLVNLLITIVVFGVRGRSGWRMKAFFVAFIVVISHLLWGRYEIRKVDSFVNASKGAMVAVVQPNTDLGIKWKPAFRDSIFRDLERYLERSASGGAELVIFPETAAPVSFKATPKYLSELERCAFENGVDVLIGFIDHTLSGNDWFSHNAAGLINKKGEFVDVYHKINLLPFGEKIPFSQYFGFLERLNFGQANFRAGKKRTIFPSPAGRFSVLICFESTFSDFTRRFVNDGAQFLVNVTNDGWFGGNRGPWQHAEMAVLRAVENRVTLLRAANTGISLIVDPAGRIREKLGMGVSGILYDKVIVPDGKTLFTRFGHLIFFFIVLFDVIIFIILRLLE